MSRRLGTEVVPFDNDVWEKKIVKVHKALELMERHKGCEPYLSHKLENLGGYLRTKLKNESGNSSDSTSMISGLSVFKMRTNVRKAQSPIVSKSREDPRFK
jgi:hypothetical protein